MSGSIADFPVLSPRCDWATVVPGGRWHAFPRRAGEVASPAISLVRASCGAGPARHPYSGIRLAPACVVCDRRTMTTGGGLFTVLRPPP